MEYKTEICKVAHDLLVNLNYSEFFSLLNDYIPKSHVMQFNQIRNEFTGGYSNNHYQRLCIILSVVDKEYEQTPEDIKVEKLNNFRREEAITSDIGKKFELKRRIKELEAELNIKPSITETLQNSPTQITMNEPIINGRFLKKELLKIKNKKEYQVKLPDIVKRATEMYDKILKYEERLSLSPNYDIQKRLRSINKQFTELENDISTYNDNKSVSFEDNILKTLEPDVIKVDVLKSVYNQLQAKGFNNNTINEQLNNKSLIKKGMFIDEDIMFDMVDEFKNFINSL